MHATPAEDLLNAVKKADIVEVQRLQNQDVDVNAKDKDGHTALILAAAEGHVDNSEYHFLIVTPMLIHTRIKYVHKYFKTESIILGPAI